MRYFHYLILPILILFQTGFLQAQEEQKKSTGVLRRVQTIQGIPPKVQYRALTHDNAGNMYVATSADVFMVPANSNQAQPMSAGPNIVDVDWSSDDGLIMLVKEGAIRFIATGKILTLDTSLEATSMDVSKSMIWVGTTNGVYTVSIDKEKIIDHYNTADGVMLDNHVHFIHTDPFNVKWVGTNKGVVRISGKNNWKLYEEGQPVTAITSTDEGAWMAADDNMWLVNSYNRWFPIDAWKDLVKGRVKALTSDGKGILYIASDILVRYDPYQEKIVTLTEDSTATQYMLLAQGPGKNPYIAGHNGLSKVIADTTQTVVTIAAADNFTGTIEVLSSPVCDGMATGHLVAKAIGGTPPHSYK